MKRLLVPIAIVLLSMPLLASASSAYLPIVLQPGGSSTPAVAYRVHGLDLGPHLHGQDPNTGAVVSEEQLRALIRIVAPYTEWIRTFSCANGLEKAGPLAHEAGLQAAVGAWLGPDDVENERQIANLISAGKAGQVDMAIVGSEVLLRHDLTEAELIDYIRRVKQELPDILVTTADVYAELLTHPAVIDAVDVVFVNYYPYWEGVTADHAAATLQRWHQQMVAAAGAKRVIVSETGWPSCGDQVGNAVPSPENASAQFLNFVSWAKANDVDYFYFEAFDEAWKANYEGPQGACWGLWDEDGYLKPGMQAVFDGGTVPDNWSADTVVGGPGEPSVEFTHVPPYGSFDLLSGQVTHVAPSGYAVAVYIRVGGGWWIKPYLDSPTTSIWPDGTWDCDITTGGTDEYATAIAAYLLPADYDPPLVTGAAVLPATLDAHSVARVETMRQP